MSFGYNGFGQLGLGNNLNQSIPNQILFFQPGIQLNRTKFSLSESSFIITNEIGDQIIKNTSSNIGLIVGLVIGIFILIISFIIIAILIIKLRKTDKGKGNNVNLNSFPGDLDQSNTDEAFKPCKLYKIFSQNI